MSESERDPTRYVFADFELDLARGELRRAGVAVPLRPKPFAMLRHLVARPGQLVAKDDLLQAVWGRRIVTEASIAKCLAEIRRALGDESHTTIRTIHGRGYRFDCAVTAVAASTPVESAAAVNAEQASAQAATSQVPARTSRLQARARTWRPYALAATLGVALLAAPLHAMLLNGDARSGADASAARSVAARDCTPRDAATASPACPHYLRASFYYHRRAPGDVDRAERGYLAAVRADPSHARSWVGLAAAYGLHRDEPGGEWLMRQREALFNAIALAPELAEAHARLAVYYAYVGDDARARAAFDRAVALGPNDSDVLAIAAGHALAAGELDRAVALQQRAAAADPSSLVLQVNLANYLLAAGRRAEAAPAFEAAVALSGRARHESAEWVQLLMLEGRIREARAAARALPPSADRDVLVVLLDEDDEVSAEASATLARLEDRRAGEAAIVLAEKHAWHGALDKAFRSLREAQARRVAASPGAAAEWQLRLTTSAYLAPLRRDSRWRELGGDCDAAAARRAASSLATPPGLVRTRSSGESPYRTM